MGAPAARIFEHARRWAEQGHSVTVVCGKPNHPDGIVPKKYRGALLYRETMDGVNVLRCWLYTTPNRGVFKRSFCFMSFMFSSMFFASFFAPKCDVVVATSPQMLCGFAGYVVSLFKRRPYVLEVRDLWPKQIIDLEAVKNPIIIGLLSWMEMFLYRRAKAVVTVAEATKDEIAARGVPEDKLYTVTNGIDKDFFTPKDRMSPLRERYGWGGAIVVMYIGTHGLSQGLATILDAAEMMQEREDIRFVFVGTGADRGPLMKQAKAMQLRNIEFFPMQDKKDMPDFYAAADICLVPLKKREVFLYNIPSKIFEIMACARPIILGAKGQAKKVLKEAEAGIAVEPEDAHAFYDAILRLADNAELRRAFGENGRRHVLAEYRRTDKADAFAKYLEEIVAK